MIKVNNNVIIIEFDIITLDKPNNLDAIIKHFPT